MLLLSTQHPALSTSFYIVFVCCAFAAALRALSAASSCLATTSPVSAQRGQTAVERRVRQLLRQVRLGDSVLDGVAHVVERLDFVVDGETAERLLDAHPPLRRLHLRQHRVALRLQLPDLPLHREI